MTVVFILARYIAELTKRLDVVNVHRSPVAALLLAAMLAAVLVSLAGALALRLPVGAVIIKLTALPIGVSLAHLVLSLPSAMALLVAEKTAGPILDLRTDALKRLAASSTIHRDLAAGPPQGFLARQVLGLPATITRPAAKPLPAGRAGLEGLSARITAGYNRPAVPSRRLYAAPVGRLPGGEAGPRTEAAPLLGLTGRYIKRRAALFTGERDTGNRRPVFAVLLLPFVKAGTVTKRLLPVSEVIGADIQGLAAVGTLDSDPLPDVVMAPGRVTRHAAKCLITPAVTGAGLK